MKKDLFIIAIVFALFNLVLNKNSFSWDDKGTHLDLSEYAAQKSILSKNKGDYLKRLGLDKELETIVRWNGVEGTVSKWLQKGAELEDAGSRSEALMGKARFNNHFHNPLKPWSEAGLNDWVGLHYTGESSLLWAQDGGAQLSIVEGVWTWQTARHHFYLALTAEIDSIRQEYFAKTFRGLGHQIHLLQDTAVPDHVRNDAHPEDALLGQNILNGSAFFETWARNERQLIIDLADNPVSPNISFDVSYNGLVPVTQLFDAEIYAGLNASAGINQGLSEYTNANFFSGDTIFAAERYMPDYRHYFPYPKKTSTDLQSYINGTKPLEVYEDLDGSNESGIWISKLSDGETVNHLLKTGVFTRALYQLHGESEDFYKSFYRDEECHKDYAALLIPRAVGYSAALLDYFFRGTLEITAPSTYVYSITDGSRVPHQFTKVKANVRNTTPSEIMQSGILQAVARYKIIPSYSPDLANYPPDGAVMHNIPYSYSVSSATELLPEQLASMNMYPTGFTFDFAGNPIPAGITDLTLQVVFKGTLGNEADIAVAVGMKDLMEPTHHSFWNLSDMFGLDGHLYTAEQIRADSNLLARAGDAHIDPYPMALSVGYMSSYPPPDSFIPAALIPDLPAGRFIRLIILTDSPLANNYGRLIYTESAESTTGISDFGFKGVLNEEAAGIWQTPTPAISFRNTTQHLYIGMLGCRPKSVDPATGEHYCPYPAEEAIPANTTPYSVFIDFF